MMERVVLYCPDACESDMLRAALKDDMGSMKTLYQAARILHYRVEEFTSFEKKPGSSWTVVTSTLVDIPVELYTVLHWIIPGPADKLTTEGRIVAADRAALILRQKLRFVLSPQGRSF